MEWRDEGIVLGSRRHGESGAVVEAMTRAHGRHLGLVHGGRSRKSRPVLQPGNRLDMIWRARLDEQLGTYQVEPLDLNAARLMESAAAVFALQTLAAHLRLLPERDPHPALYETLRVVLDHLSDPLAAGALAVRFELLLLDELGFGLDLSECASTGAREGLAYVSPKSGRAVSREAGEPWKERLLPLPGFLAGAGSADFAAVEAGFRLTGFFLHRNVYEPRGLAEPEARNGLIAAVGRARTG
jgi:DNA repair protein RecO (recombination protein O)